MSGVVLAIVYGLLVVAAYSIAGFVPGTVAVGIVAGFGFLSGWVYGRTWK